jgi:hypothetical protein
MASSRRKPDRLEGVAAGQLIEALRIANNGCCTVITLRFNPIRECSGARSDQRSGSIPTKIALLDSRSSALLQGGSGGSAAVKR